MISIANNAYIYEQHLCIYGVFRIDFRSVITLPYCRDLKLEICYTDTRICCLLETVNYTGFLDLDVEIIP